MDGAAVDCTTSVAGWGCSVAPQPTQVEVTLNPLGPLPVTVGTSETICFDITGMQINSVSGFALSNLEQFINLSRAQPLIASVLAVFKTDIGTVQHDDLAGVTETQHHVKTDSFTEMTGAVTDAQVPDNITIDFATAAGDAGTVDGLEGADLEESEEIVMEIAAHALVPDAHHTLPSNLPPSGTAGGDLSGTYANLTVKDDSHGHQDGSISNTLTITGGLVSDAVLSANVTKQGVITTLPPSGQAGGDLSGEYPSPTVKDDSHGHIDGSISDTLTITGGSVADSVLSANVTKRGQFIDVDELGFDPATQSELVNHQGNVIAHHPLKRPAVLPPMTTVTTFSAVNSNSPKFVLVECPFGTRVTGGGYTVFNIAPRIMVTRNSGENRFWHIKAEEVVNEPGDWSVSGFAICMSPHAH